MNYNDLNPVQISERTGIDIKHILNCMYGTDEWTIEDTFKIAMLFDISIDQLVLYTPEELKKTKIELHQIHTSDIKVAVRLQNYFINKKVPVQVDVAFINETSKPCYYKIHYESANILEPEKITKILKKGKKYGDVRESSTDDSIKYGRMKKIVI